MRHGSVVGELPACSGILEAHSPSGWQPIVARRPSLIVSFPRAAGAFCRPIVTAELPRAAEAGELATSTGECMSAARLGETRGAEGEGWYGKGDWHER